MNHDAVAEDAITIHCLTGQSGLADVRGAQFLQLVLYCQVRAAIQQPLKMLHDDVSVAATHLVAGNARFEHG